MTTATRANTGSAALARREPIRLALVGVGKIARAQHIPALLADPDYTLLAAVTRHGPVQNIETFPDLSALLRSGIALDAVSFCTPPQGRHALACEAIEARLHVMLEKPPGTSVAGVLDLAQRAQRAGISLFASWHSRAAPAVALAREWLAARRIDNVRATWKEDIRVWHPGQHWILEAGGMGVFDPGINCLSILSRILPTALHVESATLFRPSNCAAPIAATLDFIIGDKTPGSAELDFLYAGEPQWNIEVATDAGILLLTHGGHRLHINGKQVHAGEDREYATLYAQFSALIAARASDVDVTPLQHVADAFLVGRWRDAPPFHF